jgi:hypothetical protein
VFLQSGDGAAGITIDTSNNISTNNLSANVLTARGSATTHSQGAFLEWNKNSGDGATYLLNQKGTGGGGIIFGEVTTSNTMTERMRIHSNGFVGIGTTSPQAPLQVVGNAYNTWNSDYRYDGTGGHDDNTQNITTVQHSIIAEYGIQAGYRIDVSSDARIKSDLHLSDAVADLATLMSIQIKDYKFKDIALGSTPQKKVIAQEIEAVFPQAVSKSTGVVPDIFKKASAEDGWVELATDLKVGDQVRLLSGKREMIREVLEVRADGFRTAHRAPKETLFVYGREVDDFRSVDYDAIAMLNVSATQELAKKLEEKDAVIAALVARLSALEKRVSGTK